MHEQFLRVCSFVIYTGTRILYRKKYNLDSRYLNKINYFNYVATVNFPDIVSLTFIILPDIGFGLISV